MTTRQIALRASTAVHNIIIVGIGHYTTCEWQLAGSRTELLLAKWISTRSNFFKFFPWKWPQSWNSKIYEGKGYVLYMYQMHYVPKECNFSFPLPEMLHLYISLLSHQLLFCQTGCTCTSLILNLSKHCISHYCVTNSYIVTESFILTLSERLHLYTILLCPPLLCPLLEWL